MRGYAAVWLGGRAGNYRPAHRVFYELIHGPVSDALQVDHLCGNRGCVNPDHLEAVTPSVNTMRAKRKMFCVNGHRLAGDNIYVRKDRQNARECRTCRSGGRSQ